MGVKISKEGQKVSGAGRFWVMGEWAILGDGR
jgi:hypothetical protein